VLQNKDAYSLLYNQLWVSKDTPIANIPILESSLSVELIQKHHIKNIVEDLTQSLQDENAHKNATINNAMSSNSNNKPQELITNWDALTSKINNCTDCSLANGRKNLVIERGNRLASWMFIGDAPSESEDIEGLPFVGAAGELLDKMLLAMKLDKNSDVYICHTVKCRPPHNRNPESSEIEMCNNYLLSQINLVKPKIIITLGRIAAHTLLKTNLAIAKLRNHVHYIDGDIPLIVTYPPAYLLRNPAVKKDAWEDLQLAMKTFAKL
jgi:uracil-DNA glycosylase